MFEIQLYAGLSHNGLIVEETHCVSRHFSRHSAPAFCQCCLMVRLVGRGFCGTKTFKDASGKQRCGWCPQNFYRVRIAIFMTIGCWLWETKKILEFPTLVHASTTSCSWACRVFLVRAVVSGLIFLNMSCGMYSSSNTLKIEWCDQAFHSWKPNHVSAYLPRPRSLC